MNQIKTTIFLLLSAMLMLVASSSALADGHDKERLAQFWVMHAKPGEMEALESAMKKHLTHRKELEDPRDWGIYSPVLGSELNMIAVRAGGFTWQDMDSYREWSKQKQPDKHWQEHADKHIASYEHHMSVLDTKNSHWPEDVDYRYVGVTSFVIKPGHRNGVEEDIKTFADAAKAQNWPYNWSFSEEVGGRGNLMIAIPYKNWAAMAPPETKFAEMLAKHLGGEDKAKAVFERWSDHFEKSHYQIWARRDDLMK